MTVNEKIKFYLDLFDGKEVETNPRANNIVSSDGLNYIVNGVVAGSINDLKVDLKYIIEKCTIAEKLLVYVGENIENMFDKYEIVYSSIDGMILLINNSSISTTFVYVVSDSVVVEQIDKKMMLMSFHRFWKDNGTEKYSLNKGVLGSKSQQMLNEMGKYPMTVNFYYDMLFEGMSYYFEMEKFAELIKSNDISELKMLKKLRRRY